MYPQSHVQAIWTVLKKMQNIEQDLRSAAAMNSVVGTYADLTSHRMVVYWEQAVNGSGIT